MMMTTLLGSALRQSPPEGLPESLRREVQSPQSLPRGKYREVRAWEAESAPHFIGRAVEDAQAQRGRAWEVRAYEDTPSSHAIYGPYGELEPGDYVAFVRMKLLEDVGEESVAEMDACVSYAQNILSVRDVVGSDLALNRYVQVPIGFHYPGGKLEVRVLWRGYASLRVDCVTVFRLEGGKLEPLPKRAAQPVPSGKPNNLPHPLLAKEGREGRYRAEPRPFPDIFPKSSPPASNLLVFDVSKQPPDWQLLLLSLQGIVNRAQPQIYLLFNSTDSFWLDWMRQREWSRERTLCRSPQELLTRFRDKLKGVVITDPSLPATKNVATMVASVNDGIVVSPRLAKEMDLPVIADLRGKWQTNVEAYRWAFDNLWSRLNHHVIACSYPDHLGLRDYLVQHKVFIFWLPGPIDGAKRYSSPNEEVRLMEELFAQMPVNIPVMSYPWAGKDVGIGEGPGVTLFAEFGKYLVGSVNCSNLSVHSGIRIAEFRQKPAPPPPPLQDKVYVSFLISDGDNLPVLTIGNFPQLWQQDVRGQLPIGWTISPSAHLLIPAVVDYYYSTAKPTDYFLAAVSGVGYTYPDSYGQRFREPDRQRIFDEFLDQTRVYMEKSDLKDIWPMGVSRPELIRRYAERIPFLQSIFPDYGRRVSGYADATYPTVRNVPVFHGVTGWREEDTREERVARMVAEVRSFTPKERPAFLHLFVWNWGFDLPMLRDVLRGLGDEYVAVRPDHLAALYRQYMERQQILLRVPPVITSIEGQLLVFTASLHNVTSQPMDVRPEIAAGLSRSVVKPDRLRLAPGEAGTLDIAGTPDGERIDLDVKGAFGVRRAVVSLNRIAAKEILAPLPSGASLRFVNQFEAESLPHRSGKEEKDAQSSGGSVWSARKGEAEPGYVIFGPYSPLKEGRYLALFRLKRTDEGAGALVTLDTCVGGGSPITASRTVRAEELPVGQYRAIPLLLRHPGGAVETRVLWTGSASVVVDSIAVWEVVPQR
jgi:hypothetical protein